MFSWCVKTCNSLQGHCFWSFCQAACANRKVIKTNQKCNQIHAQPNETTMQNSMLENSTKMIGNIPQWVSNRCQNDSTDWYNMPKIRATIDADEKETKGEYLIVPWPFVTHFLIGLGERGKLKLAVTGWLSFRLTLSRPPGVWRIKNQCRN